MVGCAAVLGGLIGWVAAEAAPPPPPASAAADAPSIEMLLYLAEFGDAEDQYVDPQDVAAELERAPTGAGRRNARDTDARETDDAPADR